MKKQRIVVNDLMQKRYVYERTEPAGKNFDPEFRPELTPKEMLKLGVFGGRYMTDCRKEFPADWFTNAKLCHERHDPKLNYFGINASQPLSVWREKGWIYHEDPRGWFQWYCRYYMGRRCPDDSRPTRALSVSAGQPRPLDTAPLVCAKARVYTPPMTGPVAVLLGTVERRGFRRRPKRDDLDCPRGTACHVDRDRAVGGRHFRETERRSARFCPITTRART